jgi:two-component system, OmpR family, response regulator
MSKKVYTVLLADDDPDYLFQVAFYLRSSGYEVVAVESQAEAEQVITKMKPDVAVFDLMMESDDSGFILCYKLKRRYPEVPVILATAVARETGITFGLSSDQDRDWIRADLYLEKGVRPEQLDQEIKKLLKI